jgi:hypothetical protein
MSSLSRNTSIVRSSNTEYLPLTEHNGVLLDAKRGMYYQLNETGHAIWEALSARSNLDDLVYALETSYEVIDVSQVSKFVDELAKRNLVDMVAEASPA